MTVRQTICRYFLLLPKFQVRVSIAALERYGFFVFWLSLGICNGIAVAGFALVSLLPIFGRELSAQELLLAIPALLCLLVLFTQVAIPMLFLRSVVFEWMGLGLPYNHVPNSYLEKARKWARTD